MCHYFSRRCVSSDWRIPAAASTASASTMVDHNVSVGAKPNQTHQAPRSPISSALPLMNAGDALRASSGASLPRCARTERLGLRVAMEKLHHNTNKCHPSYKHIIFLWVDLCAMCSLGVWVADDFRLLWPHSSVDVITVAASVMIITSPAQTHCNNPPTKSLHKVLT